MRYVGIVNGVEVYEDPSCPPGQLYLYNGNYNGQFLRYTTLSKWGRFKARIKRWIQKY